MAQLLRTVLGAAFVVAAFCGSLAGCLATRKRQKIDTTEEGEKVPHAAIDEAAKAEDEEPGRGLELVPMKAFWFWGEDEKADSNNEDDNGSMQSIRAFWDVVDQREYSTDSEPEASADTIFNPPHNDVSNSDGVYPPIIDTNTSAALSCHRFCSPFPPSCDTQAAQALFSSLSTAFPRLPLIALPHMMALCAFAPLFPLDPSQRLELALLVLSAAYQAPQLLLANLPDLRYIIVLFSTTLQSLHGQSPPPKHPHAALVTQHTITTLAISLCQLPLNAAHTLTLLLLKYPATVLPQLPQLHALLELCPHIAHCCDWVLYLWEVVSHEPILLHCPLVLRSVATLLVQHTLMVQDPDTHSWTAVFSPRHTAAAAQTVLVATAANPESLLHPELVSAALEALLSDPTLLFQQHQGDTDCHQAPHYIMTPIVAALLEGWHVVVAFCPSQLQCFGDKVVLQWVMQLLASCPTLLHHPGNGHAVSLLPQASDLLSDSRFAPIATSLMCCSPLWCEQLGLLFLLLRSYPYLLDMAPQAAPQCFLDLLVGQGAGQGEGEHTTDVSMMAVQEGQCWAELPADLLEVGGEMRESQSLSNDLSEEGKTEGQGEGEYWQLPADLLWY